MISLNPYEADVSDDTDYDDGAHHAVSSYPRSFSRPLIDFVKNEWQNNPKYTSQSSSPDGDLPHGIALLLSIVTAPKFRRYLIVYLVLLTTCFLGWKNMLSPRLKENAALVKSLDPYTKELVGGWFGANALPKLTNLVQIRTLDPSLLPGDEPSKANGQNRRRLIFVGDVHGCKDELDKLLEKASFNPQNGDHLVFTGDMISKGPQSLAVVDLARQHHASCVRGNHEDRILLLRHEMKATNTLSHTSDEDEAGNGISALDSHERQLARRLSDDQAEWLDTCPVIMNVGQMKGMGQVVVVHGGLVPGVPLERQDPSSVMSMRTIDLATHVPSSSKKGMQWTKLFNKHQSISLAGVPDPESKMMTVIYGHDASSGLKLKKYTKGLDSGCVHGGKLTALIVEDGGKQSIVQVKCKNYIPKEKK
ncbi:hypothetical protein VTN02DRAFT_1886 [Thermoascus thermophilus]